MDLCRTGDRDMADARLVNACCHTDRVIVFVTVSDKQV
jgi:hypothetical protein